MPKYIAPYGKSKGTVVPAWLLSRPEVNISAKIMYGQLVKHAGRGRFFCWPSVSTLARALGMGERTVRRAIEELERHNLIEVSVRHGHSSVYHFLEHPWIPVDPGQGDGPPRWGSQRDRHLGQVASPVRTSGPPPLGRSDRYPGSI